MESRASVIVYLRLNAQLDFSETRPFEEYEKFLPDVSVAAYIP